MQSGAVETSLQATGSGALAPPRRVGFFGGLGAFYAGFGFVVATPGVWPLAIVPVATAALLGFGALALCLWGGVHLADAIGSASAARWALRVVFGALALGVAFLVAL